MILVFLSANVLNSYGFGIFVGAPFGIGWLAATLYCIPKRRSLGQCLTASMTALGIGAIILILLAFEGLICILIEAMKVMNPIKSPRSGVVSAILIENVAPVEYGQPLIVID